MEEQTLTATLAVLFGAAHAIEPGHGKTALFTYLASGKCTWKDGLVIALSSSITHSAVVLLLALTSHYFLGHREGVDHQIVEVLRYFGGGVICLLGLFFLFKKKPSSCSHCDHGHSHTHSEDHNHESSFKENTRSKKSLFTSGLLGFATGLVPCPSIVVAYLAGVSRGDSFGGLESVLLFALGMALSLVALVLLFSFGSKRFSGLLSSKAPRLNWNKVQGSAFLVIGAFTLFYH